MADTITFKLDGADEMIRLMAEIGDLAAGRAVMTAVLEGGEVLRQAIERGAPGPHIVMSPDKRGMQRGYAEVGVGPDKQHWFYRFFESGAAPHEIDPATARALTIMGNEEIVAYVSHHPGMPARPFMRPGMDAGKQMVFTRIGQVLMAELRKGTR